jgi:hypothetical protein
VRWQKKEERVEAETAEAAEAAEAAEGVEAAADVDTGDQVDQEATDRLRAGGVSTLNAYRDAKTGAIYYAMSPRVRPDIAGEGRIGTLPFPDPSPPPGPPGPPGPPDAPPPPPDAPPPPPEESYEIEEDEDDDDDDNGDPDPEPGPREPGDPPPGGAQEGTSLEERDLGDWLEDVWEAVTGKAEGGLVERLDTELPIPAEPDVADDLQRNLSEGEFVIPVHVVEHFGEKFFADLISAVPSLEKNREIGLKKERD